MTNVTLGLDGEDFALKVEGHSGHGAAGNDIVCAGISVLVQSFAQYCVDSPNCTVKALCIREGYLSISVSGKCKEALDMTIIGIRNLTENYPENIKFSIC